MKVGGGWEEGDEGMKEEGTYLSLNPLRKNV